MDRKNKFLVAMCISIILLFNACTYDVSSFEKKDLVGSWESDSFHYVVHLFDDYSCVISNLPRNMMFYLPTDCEKDRQDTTRVEVSGTWEIWGWDDCIDVDVRPAHRWGISLHVQGCLFRDKSKWKLYYEITDDDEIPYRYTYSRISPMGKCIKSYDFLE